MRILGNSLLLHIFGDWFVHFLAALFYLGFLSVFSPLAVPAGFAVAFIVSSVAIDMIDHPLFVYVTNRNQNTSKQIRKLISSRRILKAFRFWSENHRQENRLLLHSIIGQIFLVSLFLFLQALDIRSSILSGIILGMMLHILADQALDLGRRKHLRDWVFWPVREKISEGTAVASFIIFS